MPQKQNTTSHVSLGLLSSIPLTFKASSKSFTQVSESSGNKGMSYDDDDNDSDDDNDDDDDDDDGGGVVLLWL